jgi:hypothetical protein
MPGLTHLEATAIQVTTAGKPVKIIAASIAPSRPLIGADLSAYFGGGMPGLMAGDLNTNLVDWNSRLSTGRGKLLRDYADENSFLSPDTPATNPYNPSATTNVLEIVITKNFTFPVYLTLCSALSSDHLPVLVETTCRPSVQHPPDSPDFRRTVWSTKLTWKIKFRSTRNYTTGWQSTPELRTSPASSSRLWRHLLPNVARVPTNGLRYRAEFRM